jgi:hypothetical protein
MNSSRVLAQLIAVANFTLPSPSAPHKHDAHHHTERIRERLPWRL